MIAGIFGILFYLALLVFVFIVYWKVFEKAGQPGWAAIIPFYNLYILIKMAGKPGWWLILYLIPIANIVIAILVSLEIAKRFGKTEAFGIGLVFLSLIFYAILAFGDAEWQGPKASMPGSENILDAEV